MSHEIADIIADMLDPRGGRLQSRNFGLQLAHNPAQLVELSPQVVKFGFGHGRLPGRRQGGAESVFRNRVEVVAVSLVGIFAIHGPHAPFYEDRPGPFHHLRREYLAPQGIGGDAILCHQLLIVLALVFRVVLITMYYVKPIRNNPRGPIQHGNKLGIRRAGHGSFS
jgi:hypothetical protein